MLSLWRSISSIFELRSKPWVDQQVKCVVGALESEIEEELSNSRILSESLQILESWFFRMSSSIQDLE
jgi:hypothetical protein